MLLKAACFTHQCLLALTPSLQGLWESTDFKMHQCFMCL